MRLCKLLIKEFGLSLKYKSCLGFYAEIKFDYIYSQYRI